jgi:hypothetical protein
VGEHFPSRAIQAGSEEVLAVMTGAWPQLRAVRVRAYGADAKHGGGQGDAAGWQRLLEAWVSMQDSFHCHLLGHGQASEYEE